MILSSQRSRNYRHLSESRALGAALVVAFSLLSACGNESGAPSGSGGAETSGGAPSGGASSGGTNAVGGSLATGGTASGGVNSSGGASGGDVGSGGAGGGSGGDAAGGASPTGGGSSFVLTSPAFENVEGCSETDVDVCDVFPDENVVYLENSDLSPELHWAGVPEGTKSFAVALRDVSYGQTHWMLWNVPGDATTLLANVAQDTANPAVPAGSQQANANFATTSEHGYYGPHNPCNVYEFEVYALAKSEFSPMDAESAVLIWIELSELGNDEVLGVARLRGRGNLAGCE